MSDPARQPAGTPKGGQFAAGARVETGVELTAAAPASAFVSTRTGQPVELRMHPGQDARTAGLPVTRPVDWDPFRDAMNRAVECVLDGKLARGVAGGYQSGNLRVWHMWAQEQADRHRSDDPATAAQYDQFSAGLEHGVLALMSDKAEVRDIYVVHRIGWELGSHPRPGDYEQARRLVTQKRTSQSSRQEWVSQLHQAPSEAARRGFLTAGLVLSGLDEWWGLREDPRRAVLGR